MSEINEDVITADQILPAIADADPNFAAESEELAGGDDVFTLDELESIVAEQGKDDPNELIKNRFLCKRGAVMLAAQTGCGKSSFVMQAIFNFALGRTCFGLEPARKLKTLLVQGENDQRDLEEEVSGVARGLLSHALLTPQQIKEAKQAITVRTCTSYSGKSFISHLDSVLTNEPGKFDLLVLDPLFSYVGCDISKDQGALSTWLRNGLSTLLRKHKLGAVVVHHTNKPTSTPAAKDPNFNQTYAYSGGIELANWARAVLVLDRKVDENNGNVYFQLLAPKRESRLARGFCKYLEWAPTGGIYWQEIPPPNTPATPQEDKEAKKQQKLLDRAREAATYLQPGEVITKTEFINRFSGKMMITSRQEQQNIANACIARGFIIERKRKDEETFGRGASKVVELPPEPVKDDPQKGQGELFLF